MARELVVASPGKRVSAAAWARYEQVGLEPDFSLDELVLNWVEKGITDLEAKGALVALNIERTIEGGSTVAMTLRDRSQRVLSQQAGRVRTAGALTKSAARAAYRRNPVEVDEGWEPILSPTIVGRAMEVELDGVTFRLVKVRYSSATGQLELTFEDRIVYWLRRKRGERRASRGSCTRAEFILSLLREIKARRYRFVCPELHVRQPIDAGEKNKKREPVTTDKARAARQTSDVPRELDRVYPRHRIGTAGAKRLSERQVRACGELAGLSPTEALHAAQIAHGESDFYPGVVQDDPGDGMVGHGLWQMTPNAWGGPSSATYKHMQSLGGLDAMRNPIQCARQMKWMHDQAKGWSPWYGTRYLNLSSKATGSVLTDGQGADSSETAEGSASGGGEYTKSYQFTRNGDEDSWTAIKRLADEVGWRFFVVGNSVYYMSEDDLYGRRARYEITPDDPAILDLAYDVDWGKPVSECELTVVLDRWGAPPGSVVVIKDFGVPDGRWLVISVNRDYFKPTATITLRQPSKEKLEPASERTSRAANASESGGSTGTAVDDGSKSSKLYAECKRISDAGGPYVYGGGHGPSLSTLSSGQGLDCSSSSALALYRADMYEGTTAIVSGEFARSWGKPGEGEKFTVWANGEHVWIQLKGLGNAWRFDTSPYGSGGRGPRLRSTERPTSGFTARHWPGC